MKPDFRSTFADKSWRETVRAFLVFGVLVVALVGIGGDLAFRRLSINVLRERLMLGQNAAAEIAREVRQLGDRPHGLDYAVLRKNVENLRRMIQARIQRSLFVRHVEIRDRFGVRIIFVAREGASHAPAPGAGAISSDLGLDQSVVRAQLRGVHDGDRAPGQVLLAISPQAVEQELISLRRSLWVKIAVAGLLGLGVLVLGLFYVLHLIRKNRNLERARQSAERASYVGLLASGLAHEIRNPLNAMNMNLQMLEEELHLDPRPLEEDQAELLESTKSEIKRLERLVNNFLTYARPANPRLEAKDLNVVAGEVIRLLAADFQQHRVELKADLEPLLPHVETDETQFKQALINLLVNARQVLGEGGSVTLRTRAGSRGEVVVEVRDDGPGIPEEARERIFEVFYSSRGGGTGLGLPIAKQIVERHGGTIEVDSEIGAGTTFRIRLPRHHPRATEPAAAVERAV